MQVPPLPTTDQLQEALLPVDSRLTKRNIHITLRLIQGESRSKVGKAFALSAERSTTICLEVIFILKRRLFTEAERQQEFAHYLANRLTDYRHPERKGWWAAVLQGLISHAPTEKEFFLDRKPQGLPTYSRVQADDRKRA